MATDIITISIRSDDERRGKDREAQLATIRAARTAARTLGIEYGGTRQPHDEDAIDLTVSASDLDVFVVGLSDSGGDKDRITSVHSDDGVSLPFRMKLMALFGRAGTTLDL